MTDPARDRPALPYLFFGAGLIVYAVGFSLLGPLAQDNAHVHGDPPVLIALLAMVVVPPLCFLIGTWSAWRQRCRLAGVLNMVGLGLHAFWLLGGLRWLFG